MSNNTTAVFHELAEHIKRAKCSTEEASERLDVLEGVFADMDQFLEELLKLAFVEGYKRALNEEELDLGKEKMRASQWFGKIKNLEEEGLDGIILEAFNTVYPEGILDER